MTYNIDLEVEFNTDFDYEDVYHRVVDTVLDKYDCPYECEVSLILMDNDSIHEINKVSRGIDSETDVLSFPNLSFTIPGNFDSFEDSIDCYEPDSGELLLGDIVISVDRVISQANEFGHSVLREYAFLIVHSMLHLIGYDHMEEDERVEMEKQQTEIMNTLGINR